MKYLFTLLACFGLLKSLPGQCPTDISFSTQAELDAFPINYPNCTVIDGSVTISGSDIENLTGLGNLVAIEGGMKIWNTPALASLNGLSNLVSIGGDMEVKAIPLVTSLSSLGNLTAIGGTLRVWDCTEITNFMGLEYLTSVGGIDLIGNNSLSTLNGLNNLIDVGDSVSIVNSPLLTDISALSDIDTISAYLGLINTGLQSLQAIQSVKYLGNIRLSQNSQLNTLANFSNIHAIHGYLTCYQNALTNLQGLEQLDSIYGDLGFGEVYLNDISSLSNLHYLGGGLAVSGGGLVDYSGLEGITVVRGSLSLSSEPPIANLHGLHNLTYVEGPCWFYDYKLEDFSGLENLEVINSLFVVTGNSLKSFEGLNKLRKINGPFQLNFCSQLQSLTGLENLDTIGFTLQISDNISLKNIDALSNLTSLNGIEIYRNDSLTQINGLNGIDSLAGGLLINDNPSLQSIGLDDLHFIGNSVGIVRNGRLKDLTGLDSLSFIGEDFDVYSNDSLISLDGLNRLASVGGTFVLADHPLLSNIDSLSNFTYIGGNFVNLIENPLLTDCNFEALCNKLAISANNIFIENNGVGCNSPEEVAASCNLNDFDYAQGTVYLDFDCDSVLGNFDITLPNHLLKKQDGFLFAQTSPTGLYQSVLPPDSMFGFYASPIEGYTAHPLSRLVTTDTLPQVYPSQDFGFCPDSLFIDLLVSITDVTVARPGFPNYYLVCVENQGTQPGNGSLTFSFDTSAGDNYLTITGADGGLISGQTVTWNLLDLPLFQPICFEVAVQLTPNTPLGLVLYPKASIEVTAGGTDVDESNNEAILTQTVVGSFDPNDKTVSADTILPTNTNHLPRLEYLVRFQNTGTFPATFVEILDTLEAKLDARTFEMIAASHAYTLSFPAENVLKFRFDNINLPDSSSNEPASHGFVKFSIQPMPGLQTSDEIRNIANIYFDFNAPVVTNAATTMVEEPTSVSTPNSAKELTISPNPTNGQVTIKLPNATASNGTLRVYTPLGKNMISLATSTEAVKLNMANFTSGIYLVIWETGSAQFSGKVVVQ